jgi:anti-anti-sigma regulatory factor
LLSQDFNIVVGLSGDDAVEVSVSGDLDPDTLSRLVVDLARTGSVDGSTSETLTKILKRARAQGGDMVVHWAAA